MLSMTANCMFSDGFQCRFLWFINQLFICFWSKPVDTASATLSASCMTIEAKTMKVKMGVIKWLPSFWIVLITEETRNKLCGKARRSNAYCFEINLWSSLCVKATETSLDELEMVLEYHHGESSKLKATNLHHDKPSFKPS